MKTNDLLAWFRNLPSFLTAGAGGDGNRWEGTVSTADTPHRMAVAGTPALKLHPSRPAQIETRAGSKNSGESQMRP